MVAGLRLLESAFPAPPQRIALPRTPRVELSVENQKQHQCSRGPLHGEQAMPGGKRFAAYVSVAMLSCSCMPCRKTCVRLSVQKAGNNRWGGDC